MFRRLITRTAAALATAALAGTLASGTASADMSAEDQQFSEFVKALSIPVESPEQTVKLGHDICTMLTQNGAGGPNPVPAVRGTVTALTKAGMDKGQSVNVMRAAVRFYCPKYGSIIGR